MSEGQIARQPRTVAVGLLGPAEVRVGGQPVALSRTAQALVLALAGARPEVVPAIELAATGDLALSTPALHTAIWRLRRRLGHDAIEAVGDGYRLGSAVTVDRDELRADLAEAGAATDPAARTTAFARALARWRGDPGAVPEAVADEHDDLVEAWAQALADDGRIGDALDRLQALVARRPGRERAWALLIDAALAAAPATAAGWARRSLEAIADEGLSPSPVLVRAVRRAREDDRIAASTGLPAWLEVAGATAFVGRDDALAVIFDALDRAAAGTTQLVVVSGEAGIGKTRLVAEAARIATGRGSRVWAGRWDRHPGIPFRAIVEVLDRVLVDAPDAVVARLGDGPLGPLLHGASSTGPPADGDGEQLQLFTDVSSLVAAAVGDGPVLLVLDDAHWANRESLLLLHFLLHSRPGLALCVLLTTRAVDPAEDDDRPRPLDALLAEPFARHVGLHGLRPDELAMLPDLVALAARGAEEVPSLASWVVTKTGGNPMLVGRLLEDPEYLETLRSASDDRAGGANRIPARLRAAVATRVDDLEPGTRRILGVAALLGSTFSPSVLVRAAGPEGETALAEGRRAGLLQPVGGELGFVHDLVAEVLAAALGPGERAAAHRRLAEVLEEVGLPDRPADLYALAHHVARAGPDVDVDRARRVAVAAAELASSQLAFGLAGRSYEVAAGRSDPEEAVELLVRATEAARLDGDGHSARRRLHDAEAMARRDGRPTLLGRVAGAACEVALRSEGPLPASVRGLALEARARLHPVSDAELDGQLGFFTALDEGPGAVTALLGSLPGGLARGRLADRGALVGHHQDRPALAGLLAADAAHSPAIAARAALWGWITDLERGAATLQDPERAARLAQAVDEAGDPELRWRAAAWEATRLMASGRFTEGTAAVEAAYRLAREAGGGDWPARAAVVHRTQVGVVSFYTGWAGARSTDVLPVEPRWTRSARTWRVTLAFALAGAGQPDRARPVFESACDEALATPERGGGWLSQLSLLAGTAHALGDRDRAERLLGAMAPWRGHHGLNAEDSYAGALDHQMGLLLQLLGDLDGAAEAFGGAASAHDAVGAIPFGVLSRMQRVVTLRRRARRADLDEAGPLADAVLADADRLGMPRVAAALSATV